MMQTELLPGAVGMLETLHTTPKAADPVAIAIVCHPHPQQEGTMHNKVVTTLSKAFDLIGAATLRFNFRGVGKSEGEFDHAVGECDDLRAMITWVQSQYPGLPIWLSGFSFGAYISARVANDDQVAERLVSIAPAVNHADFTTINHIQCPWLVVQGDQDDVALPNQVCEWWQRLQDTHPQPHQHLELMPGVGHFFHGHLIALRTYLIGWQEAL